MKKKVTNEERRLLAAIILSGICANFQYPIPTTDEAKTAINLARYIVNQLDNGKEVK